MRIKMIGICVKSASFSLIQFRKKKKVIEIMKIKKITKQNQAEQRADLAERTMAKLQKEVDRLEGNYFLKKNECFKIWTTFYFYLFDANYFII